MQLFRPLRQAPSKFYLFLCCFAALAGLGNAEASQGQSAGVVVLDQIWHDEQRSRDIPVKLRIPAPRAGGERSPVILYSHAFGGSREDGERWGEFWAAHGYIVLHLQHPGSDHATVLQLNNALVISAQLRERVNDVKFVLDEMVRRNEFRYADLNRIGMAGHALGALTTQTLAGQSFGPKLPRTSDPRIKAAIAFSPTVRNRVDAERQFGKVNIPFMNITGTLDTQTYGVAGEAEERVRPFYAMPPGHKFLLVFWGADHKIFSGRHTTADYERVTRLTQTVTLAFWDAYLRNLKGAQTWLENDTRGALDARDRFEKR